MREEQPEQRTEHYSTAWTWLSAGQYHFGLTILTDQLAMMMMLIVNFIQVSMTCIGKKLMLKVMK